MSADTPKSGPANPDALNARLNAVQSQLARTGSSIKTSSVVIGSVGLALLVVASIYFNFGYSELKVLKEPVALINLLDQHATERDIPTNLRDIRLRIEREIETALPQYAQELSDKLLAQLPEARQKIVDLTLSRTKELVDEHFMLVQEEAEAILEQIGPTLDKAMAQLAKGEELSQKELTELEAALNKAMGKELQQDAEYVLANLYYLTDEIQKLRRGGSNLNAEQRLMRQLLTQIKQLQLQAADPSLKDKPVPDLPKLQPKTTPPKPTDKPKAKPAPTVKPTDKPKTDPKAKPAPTVKPTDKPKTDPKAKPAPTVKPTDKPKTDPKAKPAPTVKPTDKPKTDPKAKPKTEG